MPETLVERTLTLGGRTRVYRLLVPETLDACRPAPLLLAFHGAGEAPGSMLDRFGPLAEREGFIVVAPAGCARRWNAGLDDELRATACADDVAFAAALVAAVSAQWRIDPVRTFATGFSNGAALCQRLAVERADLVAAVASICATMPPCAADHFAPTAPVSVLLLMGAEDRMFGRRGHFRGMPFLTAEQTAQRWAEHNGCGEPIVAEHPATISQWPAAQPGGAEVALWWVEGAGHTFDLSDEFGAAEVAWRFLANHPRPPEQAVSPR